MFSFIFAHLYSPMLLSSLSRIILYILPSNSYILQFISLESMGRHSSFHKSLSIYPHLYPHSLLIGDFNAQHPSWDPTHPEAAINHNGQFLRNQLDSQFLSIENDIFKPTHYPDQAQYHPTIIDLIISTLSMSNYIIYTKIHSSNIPSDHTAITTTISATLQSFDLPSRLIWAHPIWTSSDPNQASVEQDLINSHILKKLVEPPPPDIDPFSEQLFQELSKIQNAYTHTATQKPKNKPWWIPELNKIRQQLAI
jgi:hypothetical protein